MELDWRLEEINEAMWGHGDTTGARAALAREAERPGTLSPYAVACFERSLAAAAAIPIERRVALENRLRQRCLRLFDSYDAVLVPTMGVASMDAGEDYAARPLRVDGAPLDHFCDAALTPIFNVASCCPVLTVPSGSPRWRSPAHRRRRALAGNADRGPGGRAAERRPRRLPPRRRDRTRRPLGPPAGRRVVTS